MPPTVFIQVSPKPELPGPTVPIHTISAVTQPPVSESPPPPVSGLAVSIYLLISIGGLLVLYLSYILRRYLLLRKNTSVPPSPSTEEYPPWVNKSTLESSTVNMEESPMSVARLVTGYPTARGTPNDNHDVSSPSRRHSFQQPWDGDFILTEGGHDSLQLPPANPFDAEVHIVESQTSHQPSQNRDTLPSSRPHSPQPRDRNSTVIDADRDPSQTSRHSSYNPLQATGAEDTGARISRVPSSLYPLSTVPEYRSRYSESGTTSPPAYSDLSRNVSWSANDRMESFVSQRPVLL